MLKNLYVRAGLTFAGLMAVAAVGGAGLKW